MFRRCSAINNTFQRVYELVRQIPPGSVVTYGEIAMLLGNPRLSRVVGYALHSCPEGQGIPCHRVVNRNGCLCPGFYEQRRLLEQEGVLFTEDGRVASLQHKTNRPAL